MTKTTILGTPEDLQKIADKVRKLGDEKTAERLEETVVFVEVVLDELKNMYTLLKMQSDISENLEIFTTQFLEYLDTNGYFSEENLPPFLKKKWQDILVLVDRMQNHANMMSKDVEKFDSEDFGVE